MKRTPNSNSILADSVPMSIDTEALEYFRDHRRIWKQKPVLRRIYIQEFFSRLLSYRTNKGISIEVGAGPGFFKEVVPDVVSTDLVWCPWLDAVADAQSLPFRTSTAANVFGLDILHHIAAPINFLLEVRRVLVPGGRLILVEPWVTPFSYLVYRYFHQEDCDLKARPWELDEVQRESRKKAFEGNQAIPYLLFGPHGRAKVLEALPGLALLVVEPFCLFAYLLSMGFKEVSLLPELLYPAISKTENATLPLWRSVAALRVFLVLEKSA